MAGQTINGRSFQHSTISLAAGSTDIETFSKISFRNSGKKKPVHNAQGKIIGYTIDNQEIEASVSMLAEEWVALRRTVMDANPTGPDGLPIGLGQIALDWTITYGNSPTVYRTVQLVGAMFQEEGISSENNQDALMVEIPLFVPRILLDGIEFIEFP
jgi:hypothetical protein